jgi:hypothetical protein
VKEISSLRVHVEYGTAAPRPLNDADGAIQHALAILGLPMRRPRPGKRHWNLLVCRAGRGRRIHHYPPIDASPHDFHANLFWGSAAGTEFDLRPSTQGLHRQMPFAICGQLNYPSALKGASEYTYAGHGDAMQRRQEIFIPRCGILFNICLRIFLRRPNRLVNCSKEYIEVYTAK